MLHDNGDITTTCTYLGPWQLPRKRKQSTASRRQRKFFNRTSRTIVQSYNRTSRQQFLFRIVPNQQKLLLVSVDPTDGLWNPQRWKVSTAWPAFPSFLRNRAQSIRTNAYGPLEDMTHAVRWSKVEGHNGRPACPHAELGQLMKCRTVEGVLSGINWFKLLPAGIYQFKTLAGIKSIKVAFSNTNHNVREITLIMNCVSRVTTSCKNALHLRRTNVC